MAATHSITNVLARLGADRLDEGSVRSIDLVDGAIDLSNGGGAFGAPYSAETILDEFTLPAVVFEDGELREVEAGSGVNRLGVPRTDRHAAGDVHVALGAGHVAADDPRRARRAVAARATEARSTRGSSSSCERGSRRATP